MRRINKGKPINDFIEFLKIKKPKDWIKDFTYPAQPSYYLCKEHILKVEQQNQSGYTEMPLQSIEKTHIDHYKKRNLFPKLTFDWNNFIIDSLDDNFGARYKDMQINDKNIYNEIFNPITDTVENYISFQLNGKMIPKPNISDDLKRKVEKTIEVFNLNHHTLMNKRQEAIILIKDLDSLSDEEIIECMKNYGFKSVIEYMLNERYI